MRIGTWRQVRLVALVSVVAMASAWAPAHAQTTGHWRGRDDGDAGTMLPLMLRSANLTSDQQTRVREILTAHHTASKPLIEQLRQLQNDLADKLFAPGTVQEADLQPQLQQIAKLRAQLLAESAKAALEVRALLTPDQLGKAAQAKDRLRQLQGEIRQLFQSARP